MEPKKISDMTKEEILDEISKFSEEHPTEWPEPFEMDGFRLVCTSLACPEQYEVFDSTGKQVGYLRLRHGHFRADFPDCGGETVYRSSTKGDGTFSKDERELELKNALMAIGKKLQKMRKLASLQRIKHVRPIEGADRIEVVGVLGWECVSKKGEFNEGDPCVYFEIDSLLPIEERYEFLRTSSYRKDLDRFRLRTVKLKKQVSQGLALPVGLFPEADDLPIGSDLTDILGVEKYEPPIPAQISGDARTFRWPIPKTDETRVQQNDEYGFLEALSGLPYYITLKLDGTSCSYIISPEDSEYHVCGRNYSYKRNPEHSFWKVSDRYGLEDKLRSAKGLALQGEIVGPGIQKNPMGLKNVDFYVFNVVNVGSGKRLALDESISFVEGLGLKFVPLLERGESFSYSAQELLEKAKGKYRDHFSEAKPSQEREGIVVRSLCGSVSFKAINNDFLLKGE